MQPSLILQSKDRKALDALEKAWIKQGGFKAPTTTPGDVSGLPLEAVELLPTIFQRRPNRNPRTGVVDAEHVSRLLSTLKGSKSAALDAVTILRVGTRNILIDGHHRFQAYRSLSRKDVRIPVQFFEGSPKQALIEAGRENGKARLQMTKAECSENAWGLVVANMGFSDKEIASGSGISDRRVRDMLKLHRKFIDSGRGVPETWREALGRQAPDPELLDKQTAAMVKKLTKALGSAGAFKDGRVWLLARALHEWGPRVSVKLYERLGELAGDDEDYEEYEGDDDE